MTPRHPPQGRLPARLSALCPLDVPQAQEEPRPSGAACGPPQQGREPDASAPRPCLEGRRQAAASVLQARWKVYREQVRAPAAPRCRPAPRGTCWGLPAAVTSPSDPQCPSPFDVQPVRGKT